MSLSKEQLIEARQIADATPPGFYSLKELYGEQWQWVIRKQAYGKWFRQSVRNDELPGLQWVRRRSNRSHEYEVRPRVESPVS